MESTVGLEEASSIKWDVVIVGAGPAGSFTAIRLGDLGLKVLLIDKDEHPRPKVCGACINPLGVSFLEREGILPFLNSAVPLTQAHIYSMRKKISYRLKGGIAIDRAIFDSLLIEKAIKHGTSVLFGLAAKLSPVSLGEVRISLSLKGEMVAELSSKVVVAAYGLSGLRSCKDDRALEHESYIGAGAIGPNVNGIPPSRIIMALGKHGYVGGVILADGSLDTAAALSPTFIRSVGGIKDAVASILEEAGLSDTLCSDMKWTGTPLLSREGMVAAERYFAVGDACGYVEPFTGEGITWALESAYLAAPIIARAAKSWQPESIGEWESLYHNTLARRKRLCRSVQTLLRTPPFFRDNALRAARFPPLARAAGRLIGGAALSWI